MALSSGLTDLVHAGSVRIGRRVVIMANAVITRAVFRQATRIGEDCRVGNAAVVSHNCQIGARCLIDHGAVIAGNVTTGDDVVFGPGATCVNNVEVGKGARVSLGAVVTQSVGAGQRVSGNFARDHETFIQSLKQGR